MSRPAWLPAALLPAALLPAALLLGSCALPGRTKPGDVSYVVGQPYQTGGVWRYPLEQFAYDDTGLASTVISAPGRTADGEAFDQTALAAGHRTLQLPAVARITNLENGRSVVVRVNARGPADPARLIEVTSRTAQLLAAANPAAFRVRVQLLTDESRQLAAELGGNAAPKLHLATASTGGVQSEQLAPPPGAATVHGRSAAAGPQVRAAASVTAAAPVPLRMPEIINQNAPRPGVLAVDLADFDNAGAARVMAARFAQLAPVVSTSYYAPRDSAFMVRTGPFTTLQQAEAALHRALAAGASDARIVVE